MFVLASTVRLITIYSITVHMQISHVATAQQEVVWSIMAGIRGTTINKIMLQIFTCRYRVQLVNLLTPGNDRGTRHIQLANRIKFGSRSFRSIERVI